MSAATGRPCWANTPRAHACWADRKQWRLSLADDDGSEDGVGFEVEDGEGAVDGVGDEAAVEVGGEGDGVGAFGGADVGGDFAGGGVDDLGVGGAGDVEEFTGGVEGDVAPQAVAADVEGLRDGVVDLGVGGERVGGLGGGGCDRCGRGDGGGGLFEDQLRGRGEGSGANRQRPSEKQCHQPRIHSHSTFTCWTDHITQRRSRSRLPRKVSQLRCSGPGWRRVGGGSSRRWIPSEEALNSPEAQDGAAGEDAAKCLII